MDELNIWIYLHISKSESAISWFISFWVISEQLFLHNFADVFTFFKEVCRR